MSAPQVSVLIPTWNSAAFVRDAIDSARNQTLRDLEIVVVDNASTDGTAEVAESIAKHDDRVRVLRNPSNVGPVRNWRRAAQEARGTWAALLFSDDWYAPRYLEEVLGRMRTADAGFGFSGVRIVDGAGRDEQVRFLPPPHETGVHPASLYLRGHLSLVDWLLPLSPGCMVFRADLLRDGLALDLPSFERTGAERHGAGADLAVSLWAATRSASFVYVDEPQVFFRAHDSNLSKERFVAAAYALARCDFYDRFHPAEVPAGEHGALRLWSLARNARQLAQLRTLPTPYAATDWMALARHSWRRVGQRWA